MLILWLNLHFLQSLLPLICGLIFLLTDYKEIIMANYEPYKANPQWPGQGKAAGVGSKTSASKKPSATKAKPKAKK